MHLNVCRVVNFDSIDINAAYPETFFDNSFDQAFELLRGPTESNVEAGIWGMELNYHAKSVYL